MTKNKNSIKLQSRSGDIIIIPKKVRVALNYIPSKDYYSINKDLDTAKELVLLFLSNFSKTNYNEEIKSVSLYSSTLRTQYGQSRYGKDKAKLVYKQIINLLKKGTPQRGGIISLQYRYSRKRNLSNRYILTPNYLDKGVERYKLQTNRALKVAGKINDYRLKEVHGNIIANNLFEVYKQVQLPTIKQINRRAAKLISNGYTTKKGKLLCMTNKNNDESIASVDEHIELFNNLTIPDFTPSISKKAGGRVTDKFNLMPSWIRSLVKINGEELAELDFSALHPNIAVKVYGGNKRSKGIVHNDIGMFLNNPKVNPKKEHLSFFNKTIRQFKSSPIYPYYKANHPELVDRIITEKKNKGYKETSRRLFTHEVMMMTEAVKRLNALNINCIYVYDALLVAKSNKQVTKKIMNDVAKQFGVKTNTKAKILGMNSKL